MADVVSPVLSTSAWSALNSETGTAVYKSGTRASCSFLRLTRRALLPSHFHAYSRLPYLSPPCLSAGSFDRHPRRNGLAIGDCRDSTRVGCQLRGVEF